MFKMMNRKAILMTIVFTLARVSNGANYYVDDVGVNGIGTLSSPFNTIQAGVNVAQPSDTVYVLPGNYLITDYMSTYRSDAICGIASVRSGLPGSPITIAAYNSADRPVVTMGVQSVEDLIPYRAAHLNDKSAIVYFFHEYIVLDGFILEGQWARYHLVKLYYNAHNAIVRNCIIRNSKRDGIFSFGCNDILVENCEIHHLLNGEYLGQEDAHGIGATQGLNFTIRGCNIHHFSGDGFQIDPISAHGYTTAQPGWFLDREEWNNALVENCTFWTGPLESAAPGWPAGTIPGESAVDTKTNPRLTYTDYCAVITLMNITVFGFNGDEGPRKSGFAIKHKTEWHMENIVVYDCENAFRVFGNSPSFYDESIDEGGAELILSNFVTYDIDITFRLQRATLGKCHIYNGTLHNNEYRQSDPGLTSLYFEAADGFHFNTALDFEMRNCAFVGTKSNTGVDHPSNVAVPVADLSTYFNDADAHNYHLVMGSPLINRGATVADVLTDMDGYPRVAGFYDIGAYEYVDPNEINEQISTSTVFSLLQNYPQSV